jgi:hypothetical protein
MYRAQALFDVLDDGRLFEERTTGDNECLCPAELGYNVR